jgi:hypothetical protein
MKIASFNSSNLRLLCFFKQLVLSTPDVEDQDSSNEAEETAFALTGPADISSNRDHGPVQPVLKNFPKTQMGRNARCFQSLWYASYQWLEYSQSANAAFCFSCRHFPPAGKVIEPAYTTVGFRNWKKAQTNQTGFPQHARSPQHNNAMIAWSDYRTIRSSANVNVLQMQSDAHVRLVAENRQYIKAIAEVLLITATQNIAQRGDSENMVDLDGNFLQILNLLAKHDAIIAKKMLHGPQNARYTSKDIQNELIAVMADLVRDQIVDEVKESGYFSICVDESKDISKKEQIALVLRYYFDCSIKESFLEFKSAAGLDAESLSKSIIASLQVNWFIALIF